MTRWPFMRGGERGESTGWSEGERRFHRATVVVYDISPFSACDADKRVVARLLQFLQHYFIFFTFFSGKFKKN
jgi:hypothetical protein